MKILHISDLHIGKRINDYSMIDEQRYIFEKIYQIIESCKPNAIIIAGDIYDKSMPSAEAVQLFDEFLSKLSEIVANDTHIFVISGNHDSVERIAFGSKLLKKAHVDISPIFSGTIEPIVLNDEYGIINFYLLPYIKPQIVRHLYENEKIETYNDAMSIVINQMNIDTTNRNVLVAHQFVTGALRADSEETSVGGLDNIDSYIFDKFDYVALGHLHRPQSCNRPTIRYSGSPLKYSFSEKDDKKSVTIIDIKSKDEIKIETEELIPRHDWCELRGSYDMLTSKEFYDGKSYCDDFVRITLTDENDIPDAIGKLRAIYHNIMELRYDNQRTRIGFVSIDNDMKVKTPLELFDELYEKQNGCKMSEEQKEYVNGFINQINI